MGKIGTAHIEIKPVLDEDALRLITDRIEEAVRAGVEAGMEAVRATEPRTTVVNITAPTATDATTLAEQVRRRTKGISI